MIFDFIAIKISTRFTIRGTGLYGNHYIDVKSNEITKPLQNTTF
jgi:hypothetical protein